MKFIAHKIIDIAKNEGYSYKGIHNMAKAGKLVPIYIPHGKDGKVFKRYLGIKESKIIQDILKIEEAGSSET